MDSIHTSVDFSYINSISHMWTIFTQKEYNTYCKSSVDSIKSIEGNLL